MKRDLDLVRSILLQIEAAEPGQFVNGFDCEGKSDAEVLEHVKLLVEAGYLEGNVPGDSMGRPKQCIIRKLTGRGMSSWRTPKMIRCGKRS